jgi:hypothetical protein
MAGKINEGLELIKELFLPLCLKYEASLWLRVPSGRDSAAGAPALERNDPAGNPGEHIRPHRANFTPHRKGARVDLSDRRRTLRFA